MKDHRHVDPRAALKAYIAKHGLKTSRQRELIAEVGLAGARQFGDGHTRYEPLQSAEHHDHLICTSCGRIVEFHNPQIEELQARVANRHGFVVTHHKLELYGLCTDCRRK